MGTMNEVREAIYQTFVTAWGNTTVFAFDNESFDPPVDAPWALIAVKHESSKQDTFGETGYRRFGNAGQVYVQVSIPINSGAAPLDTLLSKAKGIFEGTRIAGTSIWFDHVTAREIGTDGKWYMGLVTAPFQYEQIK